MQPENNPIQGDRLQFDQSWFMIPRHPLFDITYDWYESVNGTFSMVLSVWYCQYGMVSMGWSVWDGPHGLQETYSDIVEGYTRFTRVFEHIPNQVSDSPQLKIKRKKTLQVSQFHVCL